MQDRGKEVSQNITENDVGVLALLLVLLLFVPFVFIGVNQFFSLDEKVYVVEVIYCDKRPNEIVGYVSVWEPSTDDITNKGGKRINYAVTTWNGKLNVCELKVLNSYDVK